MDDTPLTTLAYFGHHRCASSWLASILVDVCREVGVAFHQHGAGKIDRAGIDALLRAGPTLVCCRNATRWQAMTLTPCRGFHVVRDPRDVVVSAYFSHKHSHRLGPWLTQEYRDRLATLSEEEGILLEMDRCAHQFQAMSEWDYSIPDILELRMEDMTVNPVRECERVFEFLGVHESLSSSRLIEILNAHDFRRKTGGRRPGEENVHSHYRKGVHGDWANHFTPGLVRHFKNSYNDLLLKLGYEQQADW